MVGLFGVVKLISFRLWPKLVVKKQIEDVSMKEKTFHSILLAAGVALFLSCMVAIGTLKVSAAPISRGCNIGWACVFIVVYEDGSGYSYSGVCDQYSNHPLDCFCGDSTETSFGCS